LIASVEKTVFLTTDGLAIDYDQDR